MTLIQSMQFCARFVRSRTLKSIVLAFFLGTLVACDDHKDDGLRYSIDAVTVPASLVAGAEQNFSFQIDSNTVQGKADLVFSLTALAAGKQRFYVGLEKVHFQDEPIAIEKAIQVPLNVPEGEYQLKVYVDPTQGTQQIVSRNNVYDLSVIQLTQATHPELKIKSAKLVNSSFSLSMAPDDAALTLNKAGDLNLDLSLRARFMPIEHDVNLNFELDFGNLGLFSLALTTGVDVRAPKAGDSHRRINASGKVVDRLKGNTHTLKPVCPSKGSKCYSMSQNGLRHLRYDLHLDEAAYRLLQAQTEDLTGSLKITVGSNDLQASVSEILPVIFIFDPTLAASSRTGLVVAADPQVAADTSNVNEIRHTTSGDQDYIEHTTTSSANTYLDNNGFAHSEQSQQVSVVMDGTTYPMTNMSTQVTSGTGEDVNKTEFSLTMDYMDATIWHLPEKVNDLTSTATALQLSAGEPITAASSSAYNPQDEFIWIQCASENGTCTLDDKLSGTAQVRFGSASSNRWSTKSISRSVRCHRDIFGDPAKKEVKVCQYLKAPSYAPKWTRCAKENETCQLSGSEDIRFGRDKSWSFKHLSGSAACNTSTFGDPAKSTVKDCEVLLDAGSPPLNYEWKHCASEGGSCAINGSAVVRYGSDTGASRFYVFAIIRDQIACNNEFAGDPHLNAVKSCDYLSYIDPSSRQDQTNLIWSTKDISNRPDTQDPEIEEVFGEEKALVEVGFSKDISMVYLGVKFTAGVSIDGLIGLKANGYLDKTNRTFSLLGGPFVDVDSAATGSVGDVFGVGETGIEAPLSVLDMYSPFTVAFTVKPGLLTGELSLDYFLDLMEGDVELYYEYDYWLDSGGSTETIYHWDYLFQTTGNIFKGTKSWKIAPVKNYVLPAVPDGYFKQKLGFPEAASGREYFLDIAGSLENSETYDPENPYESVSVKILCSGVVQETFELTGPVNRLIEMGVCSEVLVEGIRALSWRSGNGLSFGVREK